MPAKTGCGEGTEPAEVESLEAGMGFPKLFVSGDGIMMRSVVNA